MSRNWENDERGIPISWPDLMVPAGRYKSISSGVRFGFNDDLDTTEETVWDEGGIYVYPTAATAMTISSTSTDDGPAGPGARNVAIEALGDGYIPSVQTVAMNGQTPVPIPQDILRFETGTVLDAGATDELAGNQGDIYIGTGTVTLGIPATIYGKLPVLENRSLMAMKTVPAGHTTYIAPFIISSGRVAAATLDTRIVVRQLGGVFIRSARLIVPTTVGPYNTPEILFRPVPEKADIEVRATGSAPAMDVSVGFVFADVKWDN